MTVECAIPQKFHRSVMGPKGSRIQQITRDYNVQIKFPDREENPGGSRGTREGSAVPARARWVPAAGASWRSASLPGVCGSGSLPGSRGTSPVAPG